MEGSLLGQGLELMLIGMGTVFSFLTLLVFATRAMSFLAQRIQPAVLIEEHATALVRDGAPSAEVVAAISAALHEHRKQN